MEVSLYSVAAIEGYVPEGGLQGHKKQRILKKKSTHAYSFIPVLNNTIQVSKYNNLSVLFFLEQDAGALRG